VRIFSQSHISLSQFPMSLPSQNKSAGVRAKPPDKGSFPIDHFNECTKLHDDYMRCLKRNKYDNLSCRYLSREYLQCRMDHNLMAKETLERLGFTDDDETEKKARRFMQRGNHDKEKDGWLPARDAIEKRGWVKPSVFGNGKWSGLFKWFSD
jgi:cytochrome c oxidase assembly protein subunit 19